ncbi:hypothetical protein PMAYCL1PPCAC_22790, partial [Pristionchus mayeri]
YANEMVYFEDDFIERILPQWEREMCRRALALDRRDLSSSMADLLHLLHLIWQMPDGHLSVAKRVAISVLADMAHLNARTSLQQWVTDEV